MEPAKIDWKRIDSTFVEDVFYEHFRAPKWFDFLSPHPLPDDDDDAAWFCRPDCNHPKTAEDFLLLPSSSQLPSSGDANGILPPFRDEKHRDAKPKRRGPSISHEDSENQHPNLETPRSQLAKYWRGGLKSSSGKNQEVGELRSTVSGKNLLSGRDLLGHLSELCNELKRLASRVTEREENEKPDDGKENHQLEVIKKERMPLLQVDKGKERCEVTLDKGNGAKEKRRRKKRFDDDAENIPVCVNAENVKNKGQERLMQIRTNPPSPQCFSAAKAPSYKAVRSSRPLERGVLEERVEKEEEERRVEAKEGGMMDVLWFLKPCTLAG